MRTDKAQALGEVLRTARDRKGWSITRLAQESGVSAALEWPNDARMQLYVIRQQTSAYKFMQTVPDRTEKAQALREWPSDYRMQQYVYKRQVEARRAIEAMK